jgi:hypothetical protein
MILWSQLHHGDLYLLCDLCGSMVPSFDHVAKSTHENWHTKIEELVLYPAIAIEVRPATTA